MQKIKKILKQNVWQLAPVYPSNTLKIMSYDMLNSTSCAFERHLWISNYRYDSFALNNTKREDYDNELEKPFDDRWVFVSYSVVLILGLARWFLSFMKLELPLSHDLLGWGSESSSRARDSITNECRCGEISTVLLEMGCAWYIEIGCEA